MAYRADIEIGVKGAARLKELQERLTKLSRAVEDANVKTIVDDSAVQSISEYSRALGKAKKTLNETAIQLDKNGNAIGNYRENIRAYVTALDQSNAAQKITNNLLEQEAGARAQATAALKAYNAAAVPGRQPGGSMAGRYLRPGSAVATTQSVFGPNVFGPAPGVQFGSTAQFGPVGGPSSSVLGGQSSLVGDRIERSLQAARELDKVYASIDRIAAKSVATENERVQALGKGTQEVVELANSYRNISGQAKTQKQVQNEIRRGIIETKRAASEEARIRSRDYLERLRLAEGLGQERRNALLLASREEETEKRINAVLERRRKEQERLQATQRRRQRLTEDLALGAGFPLLFGGGAGAVLGGVAGAAAGGGKGGFGLQILFSALGQQVDSFFAGVSEAATTVADSLGGTTETLEALEEAGISVEQSLFDQVEALEDAGRAVAAYDAVQKELTDTYGEEGLNALRTLKAASENANEATSELNSVLQTELAPTFTLISDVSAAASSALAKLVPVLNALLNPLQGTPDPARAEQVARQGRIDAGVIERTGQLEAAQTVGQLSADIDSLQRQTEIATLNNDLTNERVVLLKEADIILKAVADEEAVVAEKLNEQVAAVKIQQIEAQKTLDLAKLEAAAREAIATEADRAAKAQERAAKEQDRLAAAAERAAAKAEKARMKELQDRIDIATKARQVELDKEEKFQARIDVLGQEIAIQKTILNGDEDRVRMQMEINSLVNLFGEEKRAQIELLVGEKFQIEQQNKLLSEQDAIFERIGSSIASGVVDTLSAAVDQTKSLADAAANTLRNIANILLQLGVNTALQGLFPGSSLFSGLQTFAGGGRPPVGKPSIVGERGPELFVPSTSGTIVPNGKFGGATNVVVNVDAKGTSASGDGGQAKQLGGLIGAAVQAELIKQQRPGGLLAR